MRLDSDPDMIVRSLSGGVISKLGPRSGIWCVLYTSDLSSGGGVLLTRLESSSSVLCRG